MTNSLLSRIIAGPAIFAASAYGDDLVAGRS
jgi:hypothetical protein